jgi:hypothetical protein
VLPRPTAGATSGRVERDKNMLMGCGGLVTAAVLVVGYASRTVGGTTTTTTTTTTALVDHYDDSHSHKMGGVGGGGDIRQRQEPC